ncbi:MAG: ThiF family adenylyltransferase [bacterium]|nr:ThiF family adenylyltransferase [bacterium]
MSLENHLSEKDGKTPQKPRFFRLESPKEAEALEALLKGGRISGVVDDFAEQLSELYAVTHPQEIFSPDFTGKVAEHLEKLSAETPLFRRGVWVYYPWLSTVVHILSKANFLTLRTARNRNLITKEEQEKYASAVIGIGGLSVGSNVALALALSGGGAYFRLADPDMLALSNTNRILGGIQNLGLPKVEMTARMLYEINPYLEIELFSEGLNKENISGFFAGREGKPSLDIVVDELDNLAVKYLIREQAKKHRLAVVMAADNGDGSVVDIERYDLDAETPFFHGRMGNVSYEELAKLDKQGIGRMITKHIGQENVTERMQESLREIGKTIVSWPQLGGAAMLSGASVAYSVRKILLGQPIESNRAVVSLEKLLSGKK